MIFHQTKSVLFKTITAFKRSFGSNIIGIIISLQFEGLMLYVLGLTLRGKIGH